MRMSTLALQRQYDYYVNHESELVKKYEGQYLVISDTFIVQSFSDEMTAYTFGVKNFGAGHFLLHKCEKGSLDVVETVNCSF